MKINNNMLKKLIKETLNERERLSMDDAEEAIAADPQQSAIRAAAEYLQSQGYSSPSGAPPAVQAAAARYGQAVARGENPQMPARGAAPAEVSTSTATTAPATSTATTAPATSTATTAPATSTATTGGSRGSISYAEIDNADSLGMGKNMRALRGADEMAPQGGSEPSTSPLKTNPRPTSNLYTGSKGNYTIGRGETLTSIARKYGLTARELIKMNPQIADPNRIGAGSKIQVPGRTRTPSVGVGKVNVTQRPTKTRSPSVGVGQVNVTQKPARTAGSFQVSQQRSPSMRESLDQKVKNYVKKILEEAAMSQDDMVKAIQTAVGVPPNGLYNRVTQAAVTNYYKSKGIAHHGHKDWVTKIQEEYDEIVGNAQNSNSVESPPVTGGPAPVENIPSVCKIDGRMDNQAEAQKLTQQIIDAVNELMNLGGVTSANPITYAANIMNAVNQLKTISVNGKVAEIFAVQTFQQSLNMTPVDAYTKLEQSLSSLNTGGRVIASISGLKSLYDVYSKCGGPIEEPGVSTGIENVVPEVNDSIAAKGIAMTENKVIFKKSYVQQVIREELQKIKKKFLRIR